jgi:membrane-bound ClpP family serine protease
MAFKLNIAGGDIRLTLLFIASLVDEAIVLVVVLLLLPRLGIRITQPWLTIFFIGLGVYAVVTGRLVVRALKKQPVAGMASMVGTVGHVETALTPEGMIKIDGELWEARSVEGSIETDAEVTVVSRDNLKLAVRRKMN